MEHLRSAEEAIWEGVNPGGYPSVLDVENYVNWVNRVLEEVG